MKPTPVSKYCVTRGWSLKKKLDHYRDKSGGPKSCWLWNGSKDTAGYGVLNFEGRLQRVHRLAYADYHGRPPVLQIMHKCDVRNCCNPSHLQEGTQSDNMLDCYQKKRHAILLPLANHKGEEHPNSTITDDIVRSVRADTRPQREIAKSHGIVQQTVSKIKRGLAWKHVK